MDLQRAYTDLRAGTMSFAEFTAFLAKVRERCGEPACFTAAPLCEEQTEQQPAG